VNTKASDYQERLRAQWIIEKSQRDQINAVENLKIHMVSNTLIEELTGETVVISRKSQRRDVEKEMADWCRINADLELTTAEIQGMLKVSTSVTLKLVKNTDFFVKVRRGIYRVRDGLAEREAVKSNRNA